ncbi:hydroxymethylglutaryl-CoA synthase family protein [Saccharopolyspora erythraea]|uniref:hydroxymethylglutaryl-CoA synthase family protein n=1 Tax=Saccharopolyspora erythraea TaxID=1836 RepID=UPI001BADE4CC|nr:hydroxymethylglutaryl-CoA synthase family protein [Saccharopolyspora erythraea]QUH03653.1 hydroxymethylglutaryl-CoA synthase family protein [Saccharopolyspora erythraea]
MNVPVGIEAVGAYCGSAYLETEDLFAARGLDAGRIGNLGLRRKSVAAPGEDVVAMAATAARPLVDAVDDKASIRTLLVATESPLDLSKAASTHVHQLLGLPRQCRLLEVKQACHGGAAALGLAASVVATEPGSRALVIASDTPVPTRGSYMEPAQGAGAVAVLVGSRPRVVELELGTTGCYGYETPDFFRPRPDVDVMDTDLSLMSYLDCLVGAFGDHAARKPGADFAGSYDLLAMHTPFPGMVRGAHRTGVRKLSGLGRGGEQDDFTRRVAQSLRFPEQVGNIYSATTLLAMISAVAGAPADRPSSMGVFSYGSGCASEFFACTVLPGAAELVARTGLERELAARTRLSVTDYDAAVDGAVAAGFGAEHAQVAADDLAAWGAGDRPRAVLSSVENYRREYRWLPAR